MGRVVIIDKQPEAEVVSYLKDHGYDVEIAEQVPRQGENSDRNLMELGRAVTQIAHEIRNPLTALSAKIQLLRRKVEGATQVTALSGSLLDEISRLSAFLSDLLEFGRTSRASAEPTALVPVVEQLVALYREQCENNQITLALELANDVPNVQCSPDQLHQIFQNILVNAIDATLPDQTVTIAVKATANEVIVDFRNPGHLKDETLAHVFDLFFTTKKYGTGIGLALVRRMMSDANGKVEASNEGEEVVFRLSFPIASGGRDGGGHARI